MTAPPADKASSGAEDIFSDVVEDFCHLSHIKQRLEEWKFRFPDSYSQAHIPLHLPRLFTPFIRLQMLQWNPLEVKGHWSALITKVSSGVERLFRFRVHELVRDSHVLRLQGGGGA